MDDCIDMTWLNIFAKSRWLLLGDLSAKVKYEMVDKH